MLTITENAQTLVRTLTEQAQITDNGGVRLAPSQEPGQLEVSLAPEPAPGDQVVDHSGARVFVDRRLSPAPATTGS